jgi:hypothetical protein
MEYRRSVATLLVHPGVSKRGSIPLVEVECGVVVVPVAVVFTDTEAVGVEFETGELVVVGRIIEEVVLDVSVLLQAADDARETRAAPPMTIPASLRNSLRDKPL